MPNRTSNTRIRDKDELHRFNAAVKDNIIVLVTEYEFDPKRTREFLVTRNPALATTTEPTEAWGNRKEIYLMPEADLPEEELVGSMCCRTINDGSVQPPVPWSSYNWHWIDWRIGVAE